MKRIALCLAAVLGSGVLMASCKNSNGLVASAINASLSSAYRADISGQEDVYVGDIGNGVAFTFPAVRGVSYTIDWLATHSSEEVVFDVWGDDGSWLKSKVRKSGEIYVYGHQGKSQHMLVTMRPRNPTNTVTVVKLRVTANGSYAKDRVHLNFIVAGDFTGYPYNNALATPADQGAFIDAVMLNVQALYASEAGISVTYERFAYTSDQVRSRNPALINASNQAVSAANETVASTGFEIVDQTGLDAWGALGFQVTDPDYNRAHGINVYLINHFTRDGTVGLSPRPGMIVGAGAETALAVGAFLQSNGSLSPRSPEQIATVLTHEIGHFLGLLHTTTFAPSFTAPTEAIDDGLSDTPRCTVLTDNNHDGMVGLGDGCEDEANLMFYQAGSQVDFTPKQGAVMQTMLSTQEH